MPSLDHNREMKIGYAYRKFVGVCSICRETMPALLCMAMHYSGTISSQNSSAACNIFKHYINLGIAVLEQILLGRLD
jgi:hypothetical protein